MDLIQSYKEELQLIRRPWTRVWVAALVLCLLLLPWFAAEHITYIAAIIFIYSIGVQGQNLLIGYTGQISFGQAGFLAIGAFTFGHLNQWGIPWPLSIMAAGLSAGLFGILVGFPSLRLKGPYLAIVTMGFGIAVYQVFVNSELLSGGRMGLMIDNIAPPFDMPAVTFNYYFNFSISQFLTSPIPESPTSPIPESLNPLIPPSTFRIPTSEFPLFLSHIGGNHGRRSLDLRR